MIEFWFCKGCMHAFESKSTGEKVCPYCDVALVRMRETVPDVTSASLCAGLICARDSANEQVTRDAMTACLKYISIHGVPKVEA
jgi:hypothetical protein